LVLAAVADGALYRLALVMFAAVLVLLIPYLFVLMLAVHRGGIQVARRGGLRFVASPFVIILPLLISTVGLIPGLLAVAAPAWTGESFGTGQGSIWWSLTSLLSLSWLAQQAWRLRLPSGLRLSADGLFGVRGSSAVRVAWDQLGEVTAIPGPTGARLQLTVAQSPIVIDAAMLGSDPSVVATIIEHFRTHPDDRRSLSDADEAIRRVEEAHRA
jgi:hypothetical protein